MNKDENPKEESNSTIDNIVGFFKKALNNKTDKLDEIPADQVPQGMRHCKKIYITLKENETNPIYLGLDGDDIYFSLGGYQAFHLSKELLAYLAGGLYNMAANLLKNEFDERNPGKFIIDNGKSKVKNGNIGKPEKRDDVISDESMEKLKGRIYGVGGPTHKENGPVQDDDEDVEDYDDEEEMSESDMLSQDVKDKYEEMDPEERKQMQKEAREQHQEEEENYVSQFEQELLGEVKAEKKVEYDFDYFKKIFDKYGADALKEELAKLPKEERPKIIKKIKSQASSQNQTSNEKPHETVEDIERGVDED